MTYSIVCHGALRLIEDRSLARRLATEARRLVEARYDWKKLTPQYLRLLSMAQQRRRREG